MVFDAAVVEHIAADLAAPLDFLLSRLNLGLFGLALLQGAVVELGAEEAHGVLAVFELLAAFGVLDEDFLFLARIGVDVLIAQAHARFHLIDVLAARAAGAEEVPADFGRVYVDFNRVVDKRGDEYGGKGRHALALGVVGRNAHEAVHAVLALEVAKGIVAFNLHRHGLDAGLVAVLQMGDGGFIAVGLGIAQIHAHQHGRPVLALRAARAGVDFQHARHGIAFLAKHVFEFEIFDGIGCLGVGLIHFFLSHHTVFAEVEGKFQFIGEEFHFFISDNPFLYAFHLFHLFLGALGIVPEAGVLRAQLLFFELHGFCINIEVAVERLHAVFGIFELVGCYHVR